MKRSTRVIAAALVLLVLAPAVVSAQDSGIGEWIRRTGAHRVGGYVTMGLAVTTAAMGLLGYEVHPYLGYTTAAFAAGAALAGTLAYADWLETVWPHAALNGLAVVGFSLNAFLFEGGSPAHIATGATSLGLLAASYIAILLVTR